MKIYSSFKSYDGKEFPNVRDLHFDSKEEFTHTHLGTFYTQTPVSSSNPWFSGSFKLNDGVIISKSFSDPKVGIRIYKDWADYKIYPHFDASVIQKLQERQKNIKLTEFPTGVISIENREIGQEIPLYEGYKNIGEVFYQNEIVLPGTYYYLQMLEILKELDKNDIFYKDIHGANFLVDLVTNTVKLIDFEKMRVDFDNDRKYSYKVVIRELKKCYYD